MGHLDMGKIEKLLNRILRGTSDANIAFKDMRKLLTKLGFTERIHASHHVFTKPGIRELLTLQPDGAKAVPYQVKQVRRLLVEKGIAKEFLARSDSAADEATKQDSPKGTETDNDGRNES